MQQLKYTSRSLRRRRNGDNKWEAVLSRKDPATGETIRTYYTIKANTPRQAERARDALILELERKGGAVASAMTLHEFMDAFLRYKAAFGIIGMMVLSKNKALLRHHINCLGADFAG